MEKYTWDYIDYLFGGTNVIGENQRALIAKALSVLNNDLIDKITEEVWFVASNKNEWAFQTPLQCRFLENRKSIIFLSEGLFKENQEKIMHVILHEVAHHVLGHKHAFDLYHECGEEEASVIKNRYEKEAEGLVSEWLRTK